MTLSDESFAELRHEWKQALPDIIAGKPDRTDLMASSKRIAKGRITMKEVVGAVSHEADVHVQSILGSRATTQICKARALAAYVISEARPDLSDRLVGEFFNRDRSTVRLAVKRAGKLLEQDQDFICCYKRVRSRLGMAVG